MDATLERALDRWRDADLMTAAQVERIREHEAQQAPDHGEQRTVPEAAVPSGSRIAEGLAYVGAALALGAGLAVFGELWGDLTGAARTGLAAVGTAILGGSGWALRDRTRGSLSRLASVLAALAVVGVAVTIAIGLDASSELDPAWIGVVAGLAAVAVGTPVHLARESWPTTLALGAAVLTAVFGSADLLSLLDGPVAPGVLLIGLGLAWAAAGWSGTARPRSAFEVTGLLAGGVGVQTLAFEEAATVVALLVGLAVAGGALAVGLSEDRTPPAVLGGLGITVFAPQLVFELFGDAIAGPLALFVGGISLITVAIVILRKQEVV